MQMVEDVKLIKFHVVMRLFILVAVISPTTSSAWYDETHLAIAKVADYEKGFNAAGPDVAKLKLGDKEGHNHFVNNPRGTEVTAEMVLAQVERYKQKKTTDHPYGAIIAYVRDYIETKKKGRCAEYHLAYLAH